MKTCCKEGCDQPRMVSENTGKTLTMCREHQQEYWRDRKVTGNPSPKPTRTTKRTKKQPRKPKTSAPAQSHVSDARTLASMLLNAESGQFVLIDPERGELWRVTAVHEQISADPERLNQHTLPILRRAGYRIVNIKERQS